MQRLIVSKQLSKCITEGYRPKFSLMCFDLPGGEGLVRFPPAPPAAVSKWIAGHKASISRWPTQPLRVFETDADDPATPQPLPAAAVTATAAPPHTPAPAGGMVCRSSQVEEVLQSLSGPASSSRHDP